MPANAQSSREIGVSDGTLNNWRNQYRDRGNAVPADPSNSESRGGAGVKRRSTLGGGYVEDGHLESSDRPYRNRVVSGNETPESSAAFERMMDLDNC